MGQSYWCLGYWTIPNRNTELCNLQSRVQSISTLQSNLFIQINCLYPRHVHIDSWQMKILYVASESGFHTLQSPPPKKKYGFVPVGLTWQIYGYPFQLLWVVDCTSNPVLAFQQRPWMELIGILPTRCISIPGRLFSICSKINIHALTVSQLIFCNGFL